MKKILFVKLMFIALFCFENTIYADSIPDWIDSIPYEKDAFMGVGSGFSAEEASENARIDILMQLSSKVDSTITLMEDSNTESRNVVELCKAVIVSNSLQGAELADSYVNSGVNYILMRYCDSCGSILVDSAIRTIIETVLPIEEVGSESEERQILEEILSNISSSENSEAVKLKRELQGPPIALIEIPEPEEKDSDSSDPQDSKKQSTDPESIEVNSYSTKNLFVSTADGAVLIRLVNFLPNTGEMSDQQIQDLQSLSSTLFDKLQKMGYSEVLIVGHANPEGLDSEENELIRLSRERAETMERFLKKSGIQIDSVQWKGGAEVLGSLDTAEGRGLNRRVDIYVKF